MDDTDVTLNDDLPGTEMPVAKPTTGGGGDALRSFFTANQRTAIETVECNVLLLAPAGTGKTAAVTAKYVLLSRLYGNGSVIAITFTKKAGAELTSRIRNQGEAEGIEDGWLRSCGRTIGTFHKMCLRVLREAKRLGITQEVPTLADENEQRHYAAQAIRVRRPEESVTMVAMGKKNPRDIAANELMAGVERIKNAGYTPVRDGYATPDGVLHKAPAGVPPTGSKAHLDAVVYQEALDGAGAMDFNDMILKATAILIGHRDEVFPNLRAVLVDEYQDTDDPQERMIRVLSQGLHLTCVGDDDQSIYEWRGANINNILTFKDRNPGSIVVTLDVNYRCPQEILTGALNLIERNKRRHAKPVSASRTSADAIRIHDLAKFHNNSGGLTAKTIKERFLPLHIAAITKEMLDNKGKQAGDIACIVRTNAEAIAVEQAVRQMGIRTKITNPNAMESRSLRRLTAWLKLIENPRDISAVATLTESSTSDPALWDLNAAARGEGRAVARHIRHLGEMAGLKQPRFVAFAKSYAEVVDGAEGMTPIEVVTMVADLETSDARNTPDADRRSHFWKTFGQIVFELEGADDLEPAIDYLQTQHFSEDDATADGEAPMEISTIHSMKGRQKACVIVPFIDGVFPMETRRTSSQGLAEERRLAYVAMTRARDELHIVSCSDQPATFLAEAGLRIATPARKTEEVSA